jgi:hypothetical protein
MIFRLGGIGLNIRQTRPAKVAKDEMYIRIKGWNKRCMGHGTHSPNRTLPRVMAVARDVNGSSEQAVPQSLEFRTRFYLRQRAIVDSRAAVTGIRGQMPCYQFAARTVLPDRKPRHHGAAPRPRCTVLCS